MRKEATAVEVSNRKMRVGMWRERLKNDWAQKQTKCYSWLRNEPFSSFAAVARKDGSLTSNLQEIDELVREAWEPIVAKYKFTSEPPWEDFERRFGRYMQQHKMGLSDITGKLLREALAKQRENSAKGADG